MERDKKYMRLAIALALKGKGYTKTNPLVGAVIVKSGQAVGMGYHAYFGGDHAEVMALKKAGKKAKGAVAYITLEPCFPFPGKKNPPCCEALVKAGLKKVVIGMKDPNPKVTGKGIAFLKKHGMKVECGLLERECRSINEPYLKFIKTGLPYVVSKMAVTLDGKIATSNGDSKWISGEESRTLVHKLRTGLDAVMVGIGTVLKDDPLLNVRMVKGREPYKVIIDEKCRISPKARVLKHGLLTIIAVTNKAPKSKVARISSSGVNIIKVNSIKGRADMRDVLRQLAELKIGSVLLEGGSNLLTYMLSEKLVDKLLWFVCPKIAGGDGLSVVQALGIKNMKDAVKLSNIGYFKSGEDLLVEGLLSKG